MNRDNQNNNRQYRNHYADFDEHGNRRTERSDEYRRSSGNSYNSDNPSSNSASQRGSNYTRAYGDFSGGTRYGEGGSTYGGGSGYGHSNYGPNHDHGLRNLGRDRNQSDSVRNGYGDFTDYNSRNYDSFGGSNDYSDYMNHNYGPSNNRSRSNNSDKRDQRYGGSYGDTGRGSTGYNNSFGNYGNTGYGSTGYNNRDEDRERSAYNRSSYGNQSRSQRSGRDDDYFTRGRGRDNDDLSYRNRDDRDR